MSKLKYIIIAIVVIIILIFSYFFLFKKSQSDQPNLASSSGVDASTGATSDVTNGIADDFLALLLNVKSINLDDSIFSDPVFIGLHDSSILLVPDGTEGRPNPFAPIGVDITPPPKNDFISSSSISSPDTSTTTSKSAKPEVSTKSTTDTKTPKN